MGHRAIAPASRSFLEVAERTPAGALRSVVGQSRHLAYRCFSECDVFKDVMRGSFECRQFAKLTGGGAPLTSTTAPHGCVVISSLCEMAGRRKIRSPTRTCRYGPEP